MKIGVFSDWHIHRYRAFSSYPDERLNIVLSLFTNLIEHIEDNVSTWIFAGDLYDQQKVLPIQVVNQTLFEFKRLFTKYPEVVIYAISGNHDYATTNTLHDPASTSLFHLSVLFPDNFILIDNDTKAIPNTDLTVTGIPYYDDPQEFDRAYTAQVDKLDQVNSNSILVIHQTPSGISNGIIEADVQVSDFSDWGMVFCGHIHGRQQITDNFLVVGSPMHHNAGDIGTKKGFTFFDSTNIRELEFLPLTNFPSFVREGQEGITPQDYVIPAKATLATAGSDLPMSSTIDTRFMGNDKKELISNYLSEIGIEDDDLLAVGLNLIHK